MFRIVTNGKLFRAQLLNPRGTSDLDEFGRVITSPGICTHKTRDEARSSIRAYEQNQRDDSDKRGEWRVIQEL